MRKSIFLLGIIMVTILSGCYRQVAMIEFIPMKVHNENQHYGNFERIKITELEEFQGITEANIFLPIPVGADWDADTKTYTLPDNNMNENGESFSVKISLEPLPEDAWYTGKVREVDEEIDNLEKRDGLEYEFISTSSENSVLTKRIKSVETDAANEEREIIRYTLEAYDFLNPTYYMNVEVEIVKLKGTIDSSVDTYINAMEIVVEQLEVHY